jgi:hypothetical protein
LWDRVTEVPTSVIEMLEEIEKSGDDVIIHGGREGPP